MQRAFVPTIDTGHWTMPSDTALEQLVMSADPLHSFLRPSWFRAAQREVQFTGFESDGRLIAAFPLIARKMGPISVKQVAGPYWPFRSIPIVLDASGAEIEAMVSGSDARSHLGKAWRLGPVQDNDPAFRALVSAADKTGWAVFQRSIAHSFDIDIAAMQAKGPWPSKSATRQSRNYTNRLARIGEVQTIHRTGADWTKADRDAMAEIEANSWLAEQGDNADTKFLDPVSRRMWEKIAEDPQIAPHMFCSIMRVGTVPAAFTFGLEIGAIRYQIANNFNEAFKNASPGRILLTMNFADAAERGVRTINWGAGDAGYKVRYGAEAGPQIVDLLFLDQRWIAPFVSPLLASGGWNKISDAELQSREWSR
ncbi:GNAT family N-acetyltransferase [Parasphingopyxis sp. CP4]|uniref:GNAT family N-acetyltransferase n=1 Tax=Parasphingopyxis sp. CP4 TaxID=2724527 RepID=UPI0015A1B4E6|nr:GNAT family N-acetyltransferase [Parasphingopyxis sp. CP4]QLC21139.1 GNAT family N-acetyltransferase [Parasphingopyxis sp. CP4]